MHSEACSFAMLLIFICLILVSEFCNGEHSVKCGESDGLSFEEAGDGVEGRYRLEWCTQVQERTVANWSVNLNYDTSTPPEKCRNFTLFTPRGSQHSAFVESVTLDLNCSHVCLSTTLDLIFNSTCYIIKTQLRRKKPNSEVVQSLNPYNHVKYIYNNYSEEHFTESQALVNMYLTGDHVTAHWFLGYIPATVYTMEMCLLNDTVEDICEPVENCRTVGRRRTEIECAVRPRGAYRLRLQHRAPWCASTLFDGVIITTHDSKEGLTSPPAPVVAGEARTALWWVAGALAACGVAAAALLAWRPRLPLALHKRVEAEWLKRYRGQSGAAAAAEGAAGAGKVVLLYARDCKPLLQLVAALTAMLRAAGLQVFDLYSAEVVREAARAPAEWTRRALARDDVRVLFLQTPAAACLHTTQLLERGHALHLQQPLLNRRVLPRAPHSGDAQFLLALRLLTDAALTTQNYRKYHIATISGLEAEIIPEVTPLQRYSLPAATALLAQQLGAALPPPALEAHAAAVRAAVDHLHDYVREKPDYLNDELIFFDYDT